MAKPSSPGNPRSSSNQIRWILRHQTHQSSAAVDLRHTVAVALQVVAQQLRDIDFVVEDSDVRAGNHA
jgi:hypothetical protein